MRRAVLAPAFALALLALPALAAYAPPPVPQGAFTAYTPTVAPASGTLTSVSATGNYQITGKLVVGYLNIYIANPGSAGGALTVSLPTAVRSYTGAAGIDLNTTRNLNVRIPGGSTGALVAFDGGASPIATGSNLMVPFAYEMP